MPLEPSVTSASVGPWLCTFRSSSALFSKIFDRPGPKSVSAATNCSGVAVVVASKWRVAMSCSFLRDGSLDYPPTIGPQIQSGGDDSGGFAPELTSFSGYPPVACGAGRDGSGRRPWDLDVAISARRRRRDRDGKHRIQEDRL